MLNLRKCCTSRSQNTTLILKKSAIKLCVMSLWSHIQQLDEGLVANQVLKLITVTVGGILMSNRSIPSSVYGWTQQPALKLLIYLLLMHFSNFPSRWPLLHQSLTSTRTSPPSQLHPPSDSMRYGENMQGISHFEQFFTVGRRVPSRLSGR